MHGSKERSAVFGVSGCNAPPPFQHQKGVFDQMADFVESFVIWSLHGAVFLWRDHRVDALNFGLLKDCVGVIALIRNEAIGAYPFNQPACLCAIRSGTLRNKDSDRHTMRIHGQMDLGVEPPFVRLICWFPPLAPAA